MDRVIKFLFFIYVWILMPIIQAISQTIPVQKQKGVCWVGGREVVTEKELTVLVSNHINWISQTPFARQRDAGSSSIRMNTTSERIWWGESDDGISKTTALATKLGIKTILKPHQIGRAHV